MDIYGCSSHVQIYAMGSHLLHTVLVLISSPKNFCPESPALALFFVYPWRSPLLNTSMEAWHPLHEISRGSWSWSGVKVTVRSAKPFFKVSCWDCSRASSPPDNSLQGVQMLRGFSEFYHFPWLLLQNESHRNGMCNDFKSGRSNGKHTNVAWRQNSLVPPIVKRQPIFCKLVHIAHANLTSGIYSQINQLFLFPSLSVAF